MKKQTKNNFGGVSFTEKGMEKFKGLTKKEQISYLSERLSPKDPSRAEQLLKGVPSNEAKKEPVQADKK